MREEHLRTSEALARGLSPKALRGKRFVHPVHGVVAPRSAGTESSLPQLIVAARLVLPPDAVVIGVTGLRLRGIDLGDAAPLRFASRHPYPVRRPGIRVKRVARLPPVAPGELPIATVAHCFVTAGLDLDLVDHAAAGDWLFRLKLIRRERLIDELAGCREHGVVQARRAASLTVPDRVDSPQETRLRLCLVLAGLPTPRCNRTLGTEEYPIGRVDLDYEAFKLILEYEGDQHRWDRTQWNTDIDRYDEFAGAGYLVQRVTARRMHRARTVVLTAYGALCRAGYRGPEPTFGPEWCSLFERDR